MGTCTLKWQPNYYKEAHVVTTEEALDKLRTLGGFAKPKDFTRDEFIALIPALNDWRIIQKRDGTIVLAERG
jgi:hypothetical protein